MPLGNEWPAQGEKDFIFVPCLPPYFKPNSEDVQTVLADFYVFVVVMNHF
jgi:hypothetical protein